MRWVKQDISPDLVRSTAKTFNLDLLTSSILVRRNVTSPEQVLFFLENDLRHLHNPFLFHAMEDAVDRILLAADEEEKVLVFGDSDTDGVTATTLMIEALDEAGIKAAWRVPRGEEPYGLTLSAVEEFAAQGGTLIITVDCGISNHEEVLRAAELGVDVILCDHHKLQVQSPPEAVAVIDPKIEGCGYPFRDLSGAGVAYKLAAALRFARTALYKQPISLFTITAVQESADRVPSSAPPRYLVEATRLHNLVETSRYSATLEEESPRTGEVLEKLASFLAGRSIFVFDKPRILDHFRRLFGFGVDIESYELKNDIALNFPQFAGRSLAELHEILKISAYSSQPRGEIDTLAAVFALLAQKRAGMGEDEGKSFLQLAALGTIADLMPLKDENRIIVRRGVEAISSRPRKGIDELLKSLGISRSLSSTDIAWQVTPLLNAAGRIGAPEIALALLMENDAAGRKKAVEDIIKANGERKKMGSDVWETLYPAAGESFEKNERRYILVGSPAVKSGITGLLASKLVGIFKVPSIVAAFKEDGTIVGSVRTANGLKISGLLAECADLFIDYGGHDAAAGFSMTADKWERFVEKASAHLGSADISIAEEVISVDAELPHQYLKPDLHALYARFEPFGEDNRPLVFLSKDVPMVDAQIVGKSAKSHLKLTLDFGQFKWPALLWDGAERLERDFSFRARDRLDILFKVTVNRWNGEDKPQLELYDARRAEPGTEASR